MSRKGIALVALGLAALAAAYRADSLLFEVPQRLQQAGAGGVRQRLAASGVAAAWSFDGPEAAESLSGAVARNFGTSLTPGKFGRGREFDGRRGQRLVTSTSWAQLGPSFTISLWVRLEDKTRDQTLISPIGLGLRARPTLLVARGEMIFAVPAAGNPVVSYPFARFDEFVHLGAVVDAAAGRAHLYENGVLMGSCDASAVVLPAAALEIGKLSDFQPRSPQRVVCDELVLFNRALGQEEIRKIAGARLPFAARAWQLAPAWSLLRWTGEVAAALVEHLCRAADRFNPFLGGRGATDAAGVSTLSLVLSTSDQRAIEEWFDRCLSKGLELDPEQASRRIQVNVGGDLREARLRPYGPSRAYWEHPKRSLVLELQDDLPGFPEGLRQVLLVPPETRGLLLGLLRQSVAKRIGLPHRLAGLAQVRVNGFSQGCYHFEDWTPPGPEERSEIPVRLDPIGRVPLPQAALLFEYDALLERFGPLLRADRTGALTTRRLKMQLRRDRRALETAAGVVERRPQEERAAKTAEWLREEMFLNGNPSAAYLLGDLDLAGLQLPGVRVSWRSSNAAVLDERGSVRRPDAGPPVEVELEASVGVSGATAKRTLRYTVIPRSHQLSVLSLVVADGVNNAVRVPCRVDYYDAEGARRFGPLAGGVKWRGNSSLRRSKKSFSLQVRDSGRFFPGSTSSVVYLMSCAADPSFLRDNLSYDLFREFSAPGGIRPAVGIRHVVVLINNEYQGLYQISERVDRELLRFPGFKNKDLHPAVVFKAQHAAATFAKPQPEAYSQVEPDPDQRDLRRELVDFITFVGTAGRDEFIAGIKDRLDVGSFLDYMLLTNLSLNLEGVDYNFFLARDRGPNRQFFLVPWDFDKAYRQGGSGWVNNHLSRRLVVELPGFVAAVRDRWSRLRTGPLADAALDARIAADAARIAQSAEMDYRRWGAGEKGHQEAVEELRGWLRRRLASLDTTIASGDLLSPFIRAAPAD